MRTALLLAALLCGLVRAERIDVRCQADGGTDAAALNAATISSAQGDEIAIHGRCVVTARVLLRAGRSYTGDSRAGTTIVQANGSNLAFVVASEGAVLNHTYTDNPMAIARLTIDGNAMANTAGSGSVCLALRAWFSSADDLKLQNCGGDGLLLSSAAPSDGDGPNGRITNSWIANVGGHGIHGDGDTTDWNLLNNWVSDTGKSAIFLESAAGWQISGNHLYGISEHSIYCSACWATTITNNYIEDFGRSDTKAPRQDTGPASKLGTYWGIGCEAGGGAASVISNNKVFRFSPPPPRSRQFKPNVTFAYIGVARVKYGVAQVNVVGNAVQNAAGTAADIGLSYTIGGGKDKKGRQLQLLSASNNVQLGVNGTQRWLDPDVTLVSPLL